MGVNGETESGSINYCFRYRYGVVARGCRRAECRGVDLVAQRWSPTRGWEIETRTVKRGCVGCGGVVALLLVVLVCVGCGAVVL